jgi:tetratricopeptide (TPR) repeat protein
MGLRTRWLLPLPTVLGVALLSFTARGQAVTGIVGFLTLRVQVQDDDGAFVRARVELSSLRPPLRLVEYSDASGHVEFTGLLPGLYTLTAGAAGRQLYRNELTLSRSDRLSTEVIHISRPAANGKPEIVSVNELSVPAKAKSLFDAGVAAVHSNRWPSAIEVFSQAIAVYPPYARAHNALGVALAITKKQKEAEQAFRRAIQADKTFAEPHYNLGKLLLDTSRPIEARCELERDVQLDPRNSDAIELLVESMIRTYDEDAAIALLSSAHKSNIPHPVQLHLEIAFVLEKHSRLELAYEQYSLVLKEDPSESERRQANAGLLRLDKLRLPMAPR